MVTTTHFVPSWVDGQEQPASTGKTIDKHDPVTGQVQSRVARSVGVDANAAILAAQRAQPAWANLTPVKRGEYLRSAAALMSQRKEEIASIVSAETGKSPKDALGEVGAAVEMGYFIAGEGRRSYGRTTTSAVPHRLAQTIRQPIGVAGLIIAANTPIANVAWKAFPALLCGNTAILKASEDAPQTALWFARLLAEVGVPAGVFNVLQGLGEEAGAPLVEDPRVPLISFTGSCQVGRSIQRTAGARLAKICLELGGKNPLIVCDDADLAKAVEAAALSAFSNAGQRCAAGSRIVVFQRVYEEVRSLLLERTKKLRVGPTDADNLGPVINARQLENMTTAVRKAVQRGARILIGGDRLRDGQHAAGYYMAPTLLEDVSPDDDISRSELFGPIACLYRVKDFAEAIRIANDVPFGLTGAVHTRNLHRAVTFIQQMKSGVVSVNGPTYGSEPHMPFGGLRDSGNGFREAGTEVLDVYSDWKTVYVNYDPSAV
jgi:aldehyde dehydrogenase (NAD+)